MTFLTTQCFLTIKSDPTVVTSYVSHNSDREHRWNSWLTESAAGIHGWLRAPLKFMAVSSEWPPTHRLFGCFSHVVSFRLCVTCAHWTSALWQEALKEGRDAIEETGGWDEPSVLVHCAWLFDGGSDPAEVERQGEQSPKKTKEHFIWRIKGSGCACIRLHWWLSGF